MSVMIACRIDIPMGISDGRNELALRFAFLNQQTATRGFNYTWAIFNLNNVSDGNTTTPLLEQLLGALRMNMRKWRALPC